MRGDPLRIIFERRYRLEQTIYNWKKNLSESMIHLRYRQNILVSRFYERFLQNCRNIGHFREFEKYQTHRT